MEVIYSGLRQTPESLLKTAIEEGVDIIGLSFLSGTHLPKTEKVMALIREKGLQNNVSVIVGGTIPERDMEKLQALGVAKIFPTGTSLEQIIARIKRMSKGEV
jgi:methylmalonyl-CoA mutase C-terminal domain/subunit